MDSSQPAYTFNFEAITGDRAVQNSNGIYYRKRICAFTRKHWILNHAEAYTGTVHEIQVQPMASRTIPSSVLLVAITRLERLHAVSVEFFLCLLLNTCTSEVKYTITTASSGSNNNKNSWVTPSHLILLFSSWQFTQLILIKNFCIHVNSDMWLYPIVISLFIYPFSSSWLYLEGSLWNYLSSWE